MISETINTTVRRIIAIQNTHDRLAPFIKKKYSKKPIHNTNGDGIQGNITPTKLRTKQTIISNHNTTSI